MVGYRHEFRREKVVEALELLPEEMQEPAAAYLLSQAKKFRALKDAIDEGMADVEAGRVVPWDLNGFARSLFASAAIGEIVRVFVSLRARSDILDIHAYLSEHSCRRRPEPPGFRAIRRIVRISTPRPRSKRAACVVARTVNGWHIVFYIVETDQIVTVRVTRWPNEYQAEDVEMTPPSTAPSATAGITCRSASITRTRIFPASSITPIICASWSAGGPIICG